ncbi:hypothetical protein [Actinosynnema sp. NPDC020468]|uniref:hypothetical protein n=1 Tax=Actinosynnema sp. NPDC020468 TaxID=3154488 RepID=UPI0033DBB0FC
MDDGRVHDAARRYLEERYRELQRAYAKVPRRTGNDYSAAAKRIFPRYRLVEAVLVEVERLDLDHLPERAELLDELRLAAEATPEPTPPGPEADAVAAERALFLDVVERLAVEDGPPSGPRLPYRRVLTEAEQQDWQTWLARRWGVTDLRWHPMIDAPPPADVLVVRETLVRRKEILAFRRAVRDLGVRRVVELREGGPGYLLDVDLVDPVYTGAEGVWTSAGVDWVGYASHEDTLAFGGVITAGLRAWRTSGLAHPSF